MQTDKKLTLHTFYPSWDIPNASPFCTKLETYLRMAGIPYNKKFHISPKAGPQGKMPFIQLPDGQRIGDSGIIIDYLENNSKTPLDQHLTEQQKSTALFIRRTLEEHLYWVIVYSRWVDPKGVKPWTRQFYKSIPAPLAYLIIHILLRHVKKELHGQGMGRHNQKQIYELGNQDIQALSHAYQQTPFFFGEKPTTIDACIYASISAILATPWDFPLKTLTKQQANLVRAKQLVEQGFFPDLPFSDRP